MPCGDVFAQPFTLQVTRIVSTASRTFLERP